MKNHPGAQLQTPNSILIVHPDLATFVLAKCILAKTISFVGISCTHEVIMDYCNFSLFLATAIVPSSSQFQPKAHSSIISRKSVLDGKMHVSDWHACSDLNFSCDSGPLPASHLCSSASLLLLTLQHFACSWIMTVNRFGVHSPVSCLNYTQLLTYLPLPPAMGRWPLGRLLVNNFQLTTRTWPIPGQHSA